MKNLGYRIRHVIKYVMHVHAIVALIGGVYRATGADSKEYAAAIMTQYALYAIFFELIALNMQVARLVERKEKGMNGKDKKKKKEKD